MPEYNEGFVKCWQILYRRGRQVQEQLFQQIFGFLGEPDPPIPQEGDDDDDYRQNEEPFAYFGTAMLTARYC